MLEPATILVNVAVVFLTAFTICLPAIPLAVWCGWRMHDRIDQQQLYLICCALLVVGSVATASHRLPGAP